MYLPFPCLLSPPESMDADREEAGGVSVPAPSSFPGSPVQPPAPQKPLPSVPL